MQNSEVSSRRLKHNIAIDMINDMILFNMKQPSKETPELNKCFVSNTVDPHRNAINIHKNINFIIDYCNVYKLKKKVLFLFLF